jgi:hypothetical protein
MRNEEEQRRTSGGATAHADSRRHLPTSQLSAAAEDVRLGGTVGEFAFLRDGRLLCASRITHI